MKLFGTKYIVKYGHAEKEFDNYIEEETSLRASDEKDAEEQVRRMIQDKYRFYKIISVKVKE